MPEATHDGIEQSPEELAAHYGEQGPADAAFKWARAIGGRDLRAAWKITDPRLRRVISQAWAWNHRGSEELGGRDARDVARALEVYPSDDPLWDVFADEQLHELHAEEFDLERWGIASRPRPVGLDHELVLFVPTADDVVRFESPTVLPALRLLMRSTPEGWLVAGFGERPPDDSWPPAE